MKGDDRKDVSDQAIINERTNWDETVVKILCWTWVPRLTSTAHHIDALGDASNIALPKLHPSLTLLLLPKPPLPILLAHKDLCL